MQIKYRQLHVVIAILRKPLLIISEPEFAVNTNHTDIVTPIGVHNLESLLKQTNYNPIETEFLVNGFTKGFDIGYKGPVIRQSKASNIPLRVGNEVELWNKIIKEVKLGHVAGSFDQIPFENYIQSPIGLVPKSGNTGKTRLIFHLSYNFGESEAEMSLNHWTPRDICTVKYNDLDQAVQHCLATKDEKQDCELSANVLFDEMSEVYDIHGHSGIFMGKTDIQSAFRLAPLSSWSWAWLIMMARHPLTKKWVYFVDKCLPFGASISCAIFQKFSNALCHIVKVKTMRDTITNYLDDFLFIVYTRAMCNHMIRTFLNTCQTLGVPIADEKTEWGQNCIVFLGLLLDGLRMLICIPEEKRQKAIFILRRFTDKKKATVKELQTLCGYLNFLNRVIYPGRVFMRRMYAKYASICGGNISYKFNKFEKTGLENKITSSETINKKALKPYHHVRLDAEFKSDCRVWLSFLMNEDIKKVVNRPMIDIDMITSSADVGFTSDASAACSLGYGCVLGNQWIYGQWEPNFIKEDKPSIEYLELYALCAGVITWENQLSNCRIIIHCDNMGVVGMVNNLASTCKKCMHLLRLLTPFNGLIHNRRITVKYIKSSDNILSDTLSHLNLNRFRKYGKFMNEKPDEIHYLMHSAKALFKMSENYSY